MDSLGFIGTHYNYMKQNLKYAKEHNLEVAQQQLLNSMRDYEMVLNDLKILKILKEFLSEANTGTGWIEININPNHDILDSEEHKKKQLLIKEWLENE